MAGNDQFEGRTRARVGRSGRGAPALGMIAAVIGAALLLLLVLAGSLDAPAAPAVAVIPPTPTPIATPRPPRVLPRPAPPPRRLYLATRAGDATSIEVLDQDGAQVYSLAGRDFALSADYATLFVAGDGALSAHESGDGFERWRISLPAIRESRPGGPSPVIPRPDGFAVGVISEQRLPDGSNATYFTFRQFDSRTGGPLSDAFALEGWNGSDAPFFSADSRRLVVPGAANDVLLLNPHSGERLGELSSAETTIAIWPLSDTDSFAWVTARAFDRTASDDHGVNVSVHNKADLAIRESFWVQLPARHWPTALGSASHGRLAVRLLEEPADAADLTMARLNNNLAMIDLRRSRPDTVLRLERQATALAFDPQRDTLYLAYSPAGSGAEIMRVDAASFAVEPAGRLNGEVFRLAVGEPVIISGSEAPEALPAFPTPRPLDQPPFNRSAPLTPSLPLPFLEPLTRTTVITISAEIGHGGRRIFTGQGERIGRAGDVAWLSVPTAAGFDVVSVDLRGAATVRARGVAAAIPRPGSPPWLLLRQPGGWALRDLANQRDQPIRIAPDLQLKGCVAAPDGRRLACQSSPSTLAIIPVADGPVVSIANAGLPLAWASGGIYGYSLADGARTLWRIDPAHPEPAPIPLLAAAEADRFAVAADRIVYADSSARELRVRDMAAGAHGALARGASPAGGMFSLSPDGRRAAYARPDGAGAYDLIVADLEAGAQAVRATGLELVAYSWRWTPAGDRLSYRVLEPAGAPQRERIVVIDPAAGDILADLALPGHTVAGVEFGPGGMLAALIYEGMQADLLLLGPDGRHWRLGMAYPLGASRPTLLYVP